MSDRHAHPTVSVGEEKPDKQGLQEYLDGKYDVIKYVINDESGYIYLDKRFSHEKILDEIHEHGYEINSIHLHNDEPLHFEDKQLRIGLKDGT